MGQGFDSRANRQVAIAMHAEELLRCSAQRMHCIDPGTAETHPLTHLPTYPSSHTNRPAPAMMLGPHGGLVGVPPKRTHWCKKVRAAPWFLLKHQWNGWDWIDESYPSISTPPQCRVTIFPMDPCRILDGLIYHDR